MNFLDSLKGIAATVAPTLATALGGPLAGTAVAYIENAFGVKADDQKALQAAIAGATPEQLLALKVADQTFATKMKELGISEEALAYKDVDSARNMQIQVKDPTVGRLAWVMIVGFLLVAAAQIAGMLYFATEMAAVPPAVWLQIGNLTGFLGNEAKQAGMFFFGSSKSSQDKDNTIAEIARS